MTIAGDIEERSRLVQHRARYRGDWFATAMLIADVAEQVAQRFHAGDAVDNLTLHSVLIDGFGRPILDISPRSPAAAAIGDILHFSPEQLDGQQVAADSACLVYSIGILFYSLLCGRAPFSSADPKELRRQIREDLPQPPRQLVHGMPAEVEQICLKALARKRMDRYATPQSLAADLRAMMTVAEDSISSDSIRTLAQPPRPTIAEPRLVAIALCRPFVRGDGDTGANIASFVQCIIASHLGASRVRVHGDRILIDSEVSKANDIGLLLADIVRCMNATTTELSVVDSRLNVEFRMRLAIAEADGFEEILPEQLVYSAIGLHACLDRHSIRLTAASKSVLRYWLPERESNVSDSAGLSPLASAVWSDLAVTETRFAGREPQLGIMQSRWEQSLEGMGQVLLLIGDEGSGKSRLLSEFAATLSGDAAGMQRVSVCCRPSIRGVAYGCVSETFRRSALNSEVIANCRGGGRTAPRDSESETAEDATALDYVCGTADEHESVFSAAEKAQFAKAVLDRLLEMARSAPVLFSVEDIQWADPATLRFLQGIVSLGPNDRILTVLTCRSDFETPWGSHPNQSQIALRSLSQRHIRDILGIGIDDKHLTEDFVRRVRQITKGLPSLIEGVRDGIIPI